MFQERKHSGNKIWFLSPRNAFLQTTPGELNLPKANFLFFCLPVQCSHFIKGSSLKHPGQTPTWPLSSQMVFLVPSAITLQACPIGFTTPNKLQWLPTAKTKSTFLSLTLQILGCQAKAQFRHSLGQTHLRFPRFPPNCPSAHTSAPLPMLFPPHSLSFHPLLYTSAQMSLPLGSLCILRGSYFALSMLPVSQLIRAEYMCVYTHACPRGCELCQAGTGSHLTIHVWGTGLPWNISFMILNCADNLKLLPEVLNWGVHWPQYEGISGCMCVEGRPLHKE